MTTEQERAAFEAWYQHHHGDRDVYVLDESGEYADKQVQGAFNVWQAAIAHDRQDHLRTAAEMMPSDAEILACLRPLYSNDVAAAMGAEDDLRTARLLLSRYAAPVAAQAQRHEFDDCAASPTGKHSESWFANGDCEYCKAGAQPDAPLFYARAQPVVNQQMTTDTALADTQRAIIEAAERRGYERAIAECAQDLEDAERYRWAQQFMRLDDVGDDQYSLGLVIDSERLEGCVSDEAARLDYERNQQRWANVKSPDDEPADIPVVTLNDAIDAARAAKGVSHG